MLRANTLDEPREYGMGYRGTSDTYHMGQVPAIPERIREDSHFSAHSKCKACEQLKRVIVSPSQNELRHTGHSSSVELASLGSTVALHEQVREGFFIAVHIPRDRYGATSSPGMTECGSTMLYPVRPSLDRVSTTIEELGSRCNTCASGCCRRSTAPDILADCSLTPFEQPFLRRGRCWILCATDWTLRASASILNDFVLGLAVPVTDRSRKNPLLVAEMLPAFQHHLV